MQKYASKNSDQDFFAENVVVLRNLECTSIEHPALT